MSTFFRILWMKCNHSYTFLSTERYYSYSCWVQTLEDFFICFFFFCDLNHVCTCAHLHSARWVTKTFRSLSRDKPFMVIFSKKIPNRLVRAGYDWCGMYRRRIWLDCPDVITWPKGKTRQTSISCTWSSLLMYICWRESSSSLFRSRRVLPSSAAKCRSERTRDGKKKFRFTWNVLSEEKREKIRQSWIGLIDYLILILKTKRSDQRELSHPPLTDILQLSQRHALFSWNVEEEQEEEENPVGSTQQDSTAVEDEESLTSFYWTWMKCFITRVFRREQWQEHTHTHISIIVL